MVCTFMYFLNRIVYSSFNEGKSLGKMFMRIKVISIYGFKINFLIIVLKEIIFNILKILDIIWILFGTKNQMAHDRVLDILVVEE